MKQITLLLGAAALVLLAVHLARNGRPTATDELPPGGRGASPGGEGTEELLTRLELALAGRSPMALFSRN